MRTLTLFALVAAAVAADGPTADVADLRLGVGVAPMPTEKNGTVVYDPSGAATGVSVKETYQSAPGLGVSIKAAYGHLHPVGLIWGGEGRFVNGTMRLKDWWDSSSGSRTDGQAQTYGYASTGIAVNLGLGWAISPTWHAEAVLIAGLDHISSNGPAMPGAGASNTIEGKGHGQTRGVRVAAYWTDPDTAWQFGLEVEYTRTVSTIEASYQDVTIRFDDVVASGWGAKGSIGYRF